MCLNKLSGSYFTYLRSNNCEQGARTAAFHFNPSNLSMKIISIKTLHLKFKVGYLDLDFGTGRLPETQEHTVTAIIPQLPSLLNFL